MTCQELVARITDYLEGAMPLRQRLRVRFHLAICTGCRAYLDQMRRTIELTGTLREDDVPDAAREALVAAFRSRREARKDTL